MDRPDDASNTTHSATTYQRESETRWAQRDLGGAWWLALAAIPLLLAALASVVSGGSIEKDLDARSTAVLNTAGLDAVDVSFSGRDATVSVPPGAVVDADQLARAKGYVADVTGVRTVAIDDGGVADGAVDSSDAPSESASASDSATESPAASDSATAAAAEDCSPVALQVKVDSILGANKIHFGEASSELTGASVDEVSQVAALLAPCGELSVTVSGHTDTRGAKSAYSQKRADSVKDALEAGGVSEDAITAVGKGDADPLGDNATREGRILNRYADIVVE